MTETIDVNGRAIWSRYSANQIPGSSRVPTEEILSYFSSTDGLLGLDLGSGSGRSTSLLKNALRCKVIALDLNISGLKHTDSDGSVLGESTTLPFKDQVFDFVNLSGLMTNLTHRDPSIAQRMRFNTASEVYRVLCPGGIAVISDFASTWQLSGCVTNYHGHALITGEYGTTVGFNPPCPTDFEFMSDNQILHYAAQNPIDRFTHHYSVPELIDIFRKPGFHITRYSVEIGRSPSGRARDALILVAIKDINNQEKILLP